MHCHCHCLSCQRAPRLSPYVETEVQKGLHISRSVARPLAPELPLQALPSFGDILSDHNVRLGYFPPLILWNVVPVEQNAHMPAPLLSLPRVAFPSCDASEAQAASARPLATRGGSGHWYTLASARARNTPFSPPSQPCPAPNFSVPHKVLQGVWSLGVSGWRGLGVAQETHKAQHLSLYIHKYIYIYLLE